MCLSWYSCSNVNVSPSQLLFMQSSLSFPFLPSWETDGCFFTQRAVQWKYNRAAKQEHHTGVLMPVSGWRSRNLKKDGYTGMWKPHSALHGLLVWRIPVWCVKRGWEELPHLGVWSGAVGNWMLGTITLRPLLSIASLKGSESFWIWKKDSCPFRVCVIACLTYTVSRWIPLAASHLSSGFVDCHTMP